MTLRHLLTFTSGIVCDRRPWHINESEWRNARISGCGITCLAFTDQAPKTALETCAQEILQNATWGTPPGVRWSYNSLHLQLAGAMAAKATNMTLPALLRHYLLDKLGMNDSYWEYIGYGKPGRTSTSWWLECKVCHNFNAADSDPPAHGRRTVVVWMHMYPSLLIDTLASRSGEMPDPNPHLASTMTSTGDDYERVLQVRRASPQSLVQ